MRDAIQKEFFGDLAEALVFIQAPGIGLGFQIDLVRVEELLRGPDALCKDPAPKPAAPLDCDHPSDGAVLAFGSPVKDPKIGFYAVFILQPDMDRRLVQIVDLHIRAILLDHEHRHPQPEDPIKLLRGQFPEPFDILFHPVLQSLPATHAPGGRCENCKGEGVLYDGAGYEETECPVCLGRRFKDEILEVRFKSLSIADVLDLEISEACKIFANLKPFVDKLKPLADTGLGYLRLGQTTAHLSGGERARLRLSIALARAKAPNTLFLFDEPARGLHKKDIEHLLALIHGLTEAGHTVIAIEHAQDFVNDADYVLELSR